MHLLVTFPPAGEERVETAARTPLALLRERRLLPDQHLALRGGRPIPLDEPLAEGDRVTFLRVTSGG
jgi:sulfur carrier protein ThiS